MTKTFFLLSLFALGSLACQRTASDEASTPTPEPATASDSSPMAESEPAIEYEPAYPTDVSSEALSEGDVAQQEAEHSHDGGDEHSHEDESHEHGEGGADDDLEH